jgi:hypothetical protein
MPMMRRVSLSSCGEVTRQPRQATAATIVLARRPDNLG